MKKLLAILLATMLMLSIGSTALAAEDPYAGLGNFEMIVGHAQPEGNPRYVSMEKFAADVAEKTNGHVTVSVFGNGQLGTEKEMLEQVVQGVTQGMRGGQFDFSPRLLMFTAPFLTNTRAEVTALLQSDLAKKVCAEAEETTGTVIINLCDAGGYRQFSNNKHPITKPEDLQGLKMRTNGMKTIDMTFIALGATTTTVPYADLYMGLKTGIADGQENPWVNVMGMKFYEVQKYFTQVNYPHHHCRVRHRDGRVQRPADRREQRCRQADHHRQRRRGLHPHRGRAQGLPGCVPARLPADGRRGYLHPG